MDKFQHDDQAFRFDLDELDEPAPIRCNYQLVLNRVAERTNSLASENILELGTGTGTFTALLRGFQRLISLDASPLMIEAARQKLRAIPGIFFISEDFRTFLRMTDEKFDAIVSTFSCHDLNEAEKQACLTLACKALRPEGSIIIGDLMFRNETEKQLLFERLSIREKHAIIDDIEAEFYWDLARTRNFFAEKGFTMDANQCSLLSWVFKAARSRD